MKIWKLEGTDLSVLKLTLTDDTYSIRFAVEGDQLTLKANQDMWTPPVGSLEVDTDK